MKLLIDADFIVYKACAAAENEVDFGDDVILVTSNFSDAYGAAKREITKLENKFGSFSSVILFFSDSKNFRKDILPGYKGHRNRKKPCGYKRVINKLKEEYKVVIMPTLEADDAMGVYATKNPGNMIVSPDKDMKQIPGQLYNFDETFTITVTLYESTSNLHIQSGKQFARDASSPPYQEQLHVQSRGHD